MDSSPGPVVHSKVSTRAGQLHQVADDQTELVAGGAQALVVAGLAGQVRNRCPSRWRANRSQWRSERAPSGTWATAKQISSASDSWADGLTRRPHTTSESTCKSPIQSFQRLCYRASPAPVSGQRRRAPAHPQPDETRGQWSALGPQDTGTTGRWRHQRSRQVCQAYRTTHFTLDDLDRGGNPMLGSKPTLPLFFRSGCTGQSGRSRWG